MDVQAEDTSLRGDASTAVVGAVAPVTGIGTQASTDTGIHASTDTGIHTSTDTGPIRYAYPPASHADTAPTPVVGHQRGARGAAAPNRAPVWLRVAVVIVTLAVIGAGVALGLVKSGVIHTGPAPKGTVSAPAHRTVPKAPLVTQTSSGAGTAAYTVGAPAYGLSVTAGNRSWVSIGQPGQHPAFAGILQPGTTERLTLTGPTQVDIGAGGSTVTITSKDRTATLKPPSAPFLYTLTTT